MVSLPALTSSAGMLATLADFPVFSASIMKRLDIITDG